MNSVKLDVIAFIGYGGSGKDYEARKYVDQGYARIRMSHAVQEIMYSMLNNVGIDYETIKTTSFYNTINRNSFTGKHLMNGLTETIIKYDPEFWFKIWQQKVYQYIVGYFQKYKWASQDQIF